MILLNTDVMAEPLKPEPDVRVLEWMDAQVIESLFLPSVVLAEWLTAVERLPLGGAKGEMASLIHDFLDEVVGPRVLPFDRQAAEVHATLMAKTTVFNMRDYLAACQIGAIAVVHRFTVATRDTAPFLAMGVPVIDPWQ